MIPRPAEVRKSSIPWGGTAASHGTSWAVDIHLHVPHRRRSNINTEKRQNSLKDSRDADQYHEQFKQLRQSTIIGKLVYRPEADGADDNNNQNTNQS